MKIELKAAGKPDKNEILEMAKGQKKVVIAGEEPLERKDLVDIIKNLDAEEIMIETSGQKLEDNLERLKGAGLTGVMINVNTMRHSRYAKTHDGKELNNVIAGINKAIDNGIYVRVNVALEEGFSDDEILDFVQLTLQHNYDVVFMPTISYDVIKGKMKLRPVEGDFGDIELFKYVIGRGRIGFLKEA